MIPRKIYIDIHAPKDVKVHVTIHPYEQRECFNPLMQAIEEITQVSRRTILSQNNTRRVQELRYMVYVLLKDNSELTLKELGTIFKREHSTIVAGMKRIKTLMEVHEDTLDLFNNIQKKFKRLWQQDRKG